jgi:hypothetical protein
MFIVRAKENGKLKVIKDVEQFKKEDFEKFDLFNAVQITPDRYEEMIKKIKIDELTNKLKELGVDVNALPKNAVRPSVSPQYKETGLPEANDIVTQIPEDKQLPYDERPSKVVNPQTKKPYTLGQLKEQFFFFKEKFENDIPEIRFCTFDERGITLELVEPVNLPRVLPNGIPLFQKVIQNTPIRRM